MISVPKPPPAPDPVAVAAAQGAMNKETAVAQTGLNSTNQYGPNGSLEYNQIGTWSDGTPRFSATQKMDAGSQQIADYGKNTAFQMAQIADRQTGSIGELLSKSMDMSQGAIDARTAGMGALPVRTNLDRRMTDAGSFNANTYAPDAIFTDPNAPAARYTDPTAPGASLVGRQDIDSNDALIGQLFGAGSRRLNPILAERRDNVEALMANKGLTAGSTGYERGMRGVTEGENDAYNQLFLTGQDQAFGQSATRANTAFGQDLSRFGQFFDQRLAGSNFTKDVNAQNFGQEMGRASFAQGVNAQNFGMQNERFQLGNAAQAQNFGQNLAANQQNFGQDATANEQNFGQQMQVYQAAMAQRAAALQEISAGRNQPLNEIAALMSGSQITPQNFVSTPQSQVQPTNYTGLVGDIYKGQIAGYQAENQARSSMFSGLGSIFGGLGSFAKLSDERLKTDIVQLGRLHNGLGVYEYRFKAGGPREIGVMAQEVARVMPDAVLTMPSGFLAVDYARATGI